MSRKRKIGFVIPWYGEDIVGGAEAQCRRLAEELVKTGLKVEVLTTCARDLLSGWSRNHYREGIYEVSGVTVRRFRLRPADLTSFRIINDRLLAGLPISSEEEQCFITESVNSDRLYDFIEKHRADYYYVFTPYLFGTTYWGSQCCAGEGFLIPCLHDEAYAGLQIFRSLFKRFKSILFYSRPEMTLARRLYQMDAAHLTLIGGGVDTDIRGNGAIFREQHNLSAPFILYVGRRDETKNLPLLVRYFCFYKERNRSNVKLVLAGDGPVEIPAGFETQIFDLGFLSEQAKHDAYAAATLVCQPSVKESFSIVIMEAWLQETPVLVHADCPVTVYHCLQSNGGLYFRDYGEFEGCLSYLLGNLEVRIKMGWLGRRYVERNCRWERVVARFVEAVLGPTEAG
jgi:glycosyltransferase involved in cell wall biosynthesis